MANVQVADQRVSKWKYCRECLPQNGESTRRQSIPWRSEKLGFRLARQMTCPQISMTYPSGLGNIWALQHLVLGHRSTRECDIRAACSWSSRAWSLSILMILSEAMLHPEARGLRPRHFLGTIPLALNLGLRLRLESSLRPCSDNLDI